MIVVIVFYVISIIWGWKNKSCVIMGQRPITYPGRGD